MDALLLQPPPGDLTGPYPALAYLKSYAAQYDYDAQIRDLGIEALYYLTTEEHICKLTERADSIRKELEDKPVSTSQFQEHYGLLLMAMGIGLKPHLVSKALNDFKIPEIFYDYPQYKISCGFLDAFYRLLSAVHYPTIVTPSEYPTVRMLSNTAQNQKAAMDKVLEHQYPRLNPFIEFYEKILFPQIDANPPKIIGISMVFASQSVQALVLGHLIKKRFPHIHVTLGGAYLSQWIMQMDDSRLEHIFTCTDSIICGEGERPFAELLKHFSLLTSHFSLPSLPNLIYRNPSDGRFQRFNELTYTDVAHQPPPDYSDLNFSDYLTPVPIIPYAVSRGCYWGKCVFCQNRYGDFHMRRYQTVPVEKAVAEMTQLAEQYGSTHFNFSNDVIDPAYLRVFVSHFSFLTSHFIWNTDLRAEKAFTPEFCKELASAGLNCVAIGFESGCQKTLDAMDKGNQTETTAQVMKNLYDAGIATQAMGIFGFPGESEQDGEITVKFLEENADRISYYVMGLLMIMPGSRMYENPDKYGVTSLSYEGNPLMTPEPVWRSDIRMSADAVNRLYDRLSQLEEQYAINEYPYIGGLSTNHGFLYFHQYGPGILKHLKTEETSRYHELSRKLGISSEGTRGKKLKTIVPRMTLPFKIYCLPRFQAGAWERDKAQILIDPINIPIQISDAEVKLLQRIDGRRNLKSVLHKIQDASPERLLMFLLHRICQGCVTLRL